MGRKCTHYSALMQKNWILWKRNLCGSLCEILFPVFLMAILIPIRLSIDKTFEKGQSLVKDNSYLVYMPDMANPANNANFEFMDLGFSYFWFNCQSSDDNRQFKSRDIIALSGDQEFIDFMTIKVAMFSNDQQTFKVQEFASSEEIAAYLRDPGYDTADTHPGICFGASGKRDGDNFDFKLHFYDQQGYAPQIPTQNNSILNIYKSEPDTGSFQRYRNAYTLLNNWMVNWALKQITGDPAAFISMGLAMLKPNDYWKDDFNQFLTGFFGFFMLLVYLAPISRTVSRIVGEKESKAREGMKMMGLSDFPYWMSWLTYFTILAAVISLFITITLSINVLPNTNKIVLFLILFIFGMSNFGFLVLMSSFFSRARTAAIVCTIVFFCTSFIDNAVSDEAQGEQIKNILSVFPVVAIYRISNNLGYFESQGSGLDFESVVDIYQNYRVSAGLIGMSIAFALFFLLGLYFENIIQGTFGVKRGPCFCCMPSFWCQKKKTRTAYVSAHDDSKEFISSYMQNHPTKFEELSEKLKKQQQDGDCLRVDGLVKKFKDKLAVNGFEVSMFQDQIFALLGHNGAGKTTTLSMLTGLLPATAGTAQVFDTDIFHEMDHFRTFLGVCPQHDILFPQLTPKEHLEIFTRFKNFQGDRKKEVEEMLLNIDLAESKNVMSKNLSGGQKRKLSVGIALIAGSKVVMLDEPTSGMDLTARRKLWNMLKQQKDGRIIILTTHYMDEADILGDRIGIMVDGRIICLGSSLFLKTNLGVGYNLTLVKKDKQMHPELDRFITQNLPGSKFVSEISGEVKYLVDKESSQHFKTFFQEFDQKHQSLGVLSYGLSVTTLEDVFLKVGRGDEEHEENEQAIKTLQKQKTLGNDLEAGDEFNLTRDHVKGAGANCCMQFKAVLRKRFIMSKRNFKGLLVEIFVPIVLLIVGLALSQLQFFYDSPAQKITPDPFPQPQRIVYNDNLLGGSSDITSADIISHLDTTAFDPKPVTIPSGSTGIETLTAFDEKVYEASQTDPLEPYRYGSYYFYDLNKASHQYKMITFVNSTQEDLPAYFPQFAYEAILKEENPSVKITMQNEPFPVTSVQREREASANVIFICFLLSIAFGMLPSGAVSHIVKERQLNVKHQQLISGMNLFSYWASNYVYDVIKAMIPCAAAIGLIEAFGVEIDLAWAFFLLLPFAIVPYTYATSFIFKTESGAQNFTSNHTFFFAGIGAIAAYIMYIIPSTRDASLITSWVLRIFPVFCLTRGMIFTSSTQTIMIFAELETEPGPLDKEVALYDFIMIIAHSFIWWIVIIIIENCSCGRGKRKSNKTLGMLDDDVIAEQERVRKTDPKSLTVLVDKLYKEFPPVKGTNEPKQAVNEVSFGLEFGECFALLGVNGAGKTTTFKCLTKDEIPTEGSIRVHGFDIMTQFAQARKSIGYCPQFDTIFESLTVREHLEYYCNIKGIPFDKHHELIEQQLDEMNLREYENKQSGQLSGGNKRKLSVAMAMIGNPPIVFLDEPSTGMDPQARRFMWSVISKISTQRKKSSVILTTHSMEEAEALCTKMGIMVSGQFQCFGTGQHIKNKFGTGYEIETKIRNYTDEEIKAFLLRNNITQPKLNKKEAKRAISTLASQDKQYIRKEFKKNKLGHDVYMEVYHEEEVDSSTLAEWVMTLSSGIDVINKLHQHFESVEILEYYNSYFRFRVPKGEKTIGFTFGFLEDIKDDCQVSEYSCSQTTLEQIFNAFALEQDENKMDKILFNRGENGPIHGLHRQLTNKSSSRRGESIPDGVEGSGKLEVESMSAAK